MENNVHVYTTG